MAANVTEYGTPTVPLGRMLVVTVTPATMTRVSRCVACWGAAPVGLLSRTVKLRLKGLPFVEVGVPLILPVDESNDKPVGRATSEVQL